MNTEEDIFMNTSDSRISSQGLEQSRKPSLHIHKESFDSYDDFDTQTFHNDRSPRID